jgi:hypothetical protein
MRRMMVWRIGALSLAGVLVTGCQLLLGTDGYFNGGSGAGGSDAGVVPSCDPTSPSFKLSDACGVFVRADAGDTGDGSMEKPYRTFAEALTSEKSTLYLCAGATPFNEALVLDKKVVIYGGFACDAGWSYGGDKKTALTAGPDEIPVALKAAASGTELHDLTITAAASAHEGGSSVALVTAHADLALIGVDLVAAAGRKGTAGTAIADVQTPGTADGTKGTVAGTCSNTVGLIQGGPGGVNHCAGVTTDGGNGGKGIGDTTGGQGVQGSPADAKNIGGAGQSGNSCGQGGQGEDGGVGDAGTGARGRGDITSTGYGPPSAMVGGPGDPGHGGGGGGGAKSCNAANGAGSSGGGGGAGGCGGLPGNAGQSGGSSIGIIALNAQLTLSSVSISVGTAGAGGAGGDGQKGGPGGMQGMQGGAGACPGGLGGAGGKGGPGGGGAGGHSLGIAFRGGPKPNLASATVSHATGANGGKGGDGDTTPQTQGDGGLGCATLDFADTTAAACVSK